MCGTTYARFFTSVESKAARAVQIDAKSKSGSKSVSEAIRAKYKLADDPAVMEQLAEGVEAFDARRKGSYANMALRCL